MRKILRRALNLSVRWQRGSYTAVRRISSSSSGAWTGCSAWTPLRRCVAPSLTIIDQDVQWQVPLLEALDKLTDGPQGGEIQFGKLHWNGHTEAHSHQSHCKRIISASAKTSKSVLIISYSGLVAFLLHYNAGAPAAVTSHLILPPEHHRSLTQR